MQIISTSHLGLGSRDVMQAAEEVIKKIQHQQDELNKKKSKTNSGNGKDKVFVSSLH